MLPSLFISGERGREWNVGRAAAYGAALGAVAALIKTFGPLRIVAPLSANLTERLTGNALEIAGAALGFALLCAGVALLRNIIARRLIWPDLS